MEIKAELKQPYIEKERINFIVEQNHKLGYEIREVETTYEVEEQVPSIIKETITETIQEPVLDENGNLILDENGNPIFEEKIVEREVERTETEIVTEEIQVPVLDEEWNPVLDNEGNPTFETKTVEKEVVKYKTETVKKTGYNLEAWGYTEEEKQQQERERIGMLFMTGADVERAIYKVKGIDFDDIITMVKNNPAIDAKALKIEFKANNFYRGNPYISQVGTLLGFTPEQMDRFFETKDYHYLTTCKLTINTTPENATVTIIPEIIPYNTTAHYKIECEGYITKEGDIEMVKDEVLEVVLDKNTTDTEQLTDVSSEVEPKPTDK